MDKFADIPRPGSPATFKIGAPSMIHGNNVVDNARILTNGGNGLDHIEILLFHTPALNNIPSTREVRALKEIRDRTQTTYTVHLPSSLEIASQDRKVREHSISMIENIWHKTSPLNPEYYILHIPVTPPTLVPVPGQYFRSETSQPWEAWTSRAMESLKKIRERVGDGMEFLIENINYSPKFIEPMVTAGYGKFCLDLGHLLLGDEIVTDVLDRFLDRTREIHLHGVKGFSEHLSLDVLPVERVAKWISYLTRWDDGGILNLEVFSPRDLNASLGMLTGIVAELNSRN
jgi:adenosylcobalamin phosphodiesterase